MEKAFTEALEYIRKQYKGSPEIGIILGTGLGRLTKEIDEEKVIPYNFIPHFPISTVESHFGRLIFGRIGDKEVVAMQGRFHYYEGYSMQENHFSGQNHEITWDKDIIYLKCCRRNEQKVSERRFNDPG